MQTVTTDAVLRRALRAKVCPICRFRPAGSESLSANVQRDCEPQCAIFANVPTLASIAARTACDPLAGFEHAIEEEICQYCTLKETSGDYCAERLVRNCPLSCYAAQVLATIEPIVVRHCECRKE